MNVYTSGQEAYPVAAQDTPATPTIEYQRAKYWWDLLGLPGTAEAGYNGKDELPGVFRCPFQKPITVKALGANDQGVVEMFEHEMLPLSSYGYNGWGSSDHRNGLGLGGQLRAMAGPMDFAATRESAVVAPAEMIAFGDGFQRASAPLTAAQVTSMLAIFSPWQWDDYASLPTFKAHRAKLNRVFCDGHVEPVEMKKPFVPNDYELSRWNRDNLPHRETWRN